MNKTTLLTAIRSFSPRSRPSDTGSLRFVFLAAALWAAAAADLAAQCDPDPPSSSEAVASLDSSGFLQANLKDPLDINTPAEARAELEKIKSAAEVLGRVADESIQFVKREDVLEQHRLVQRVYERLGDEILEYEDRLTRGLMDLYYGLIRKAGQEDRSLSRLAGQSVTDYRMVYSAARQILRDQGESYDNYYLAQQLGMDVLAPAPDFEWLDRFIEAAVEFAHDHPAQGDIFGPAMAPLLCDAYQLYRDDDERRRYLVRAFNLLARYERNDMARAQSIYRFDRRVREVFDLRPADWSRAGSPCDLSLDTMEMPRYEIRPEIVSADAERLHECVREVRGFLPSGPVEEGRTRHAWLPFRRYGEFLFAVADVLERQATGGGEAYEKRYLLMREGFKAYLDGLRYSTQQGNSEGVEELRIDFGRRARRYGEELFWAMEWDRVTELMELLLPDSEIPAELAARQMARDALSRPGRSPGLPDSAPREPGRDQADQQAEQLELDLMARWEAPSGVLRGPQLKAMHGLMARAHSMLGEQTLAVWHLMRSDVLRSRLEEDRRTFREFGIQPGRRGKQP